MTAWAHLPNAKHIDWVIKSVEEHPSIWHDVYDYERNDVYLDAWGKVRRMLDSEIEDIVRMAWNDVPARYGDYAWQAATDGIMTLFAYDDCGYMIDSDVGELKLIAAFGDPRAILLLPACVAFNEIKLLTSVSIVL